MLKIKEDDNLSRAAQILEIAPAPLCTLVEALAWLYDNDELDPYAGETLGKLFDDEPTREGKFLLAFEPHELDALRELRLYLFGAEAPCPNCGWETTLKEYEGGRLRDMCPHCGHIQID